MKNNIIPALIISAVLIVVALLVRQNGTAQFNAILAQEKKEQNDQTQILRIAAGVSKALFEGPKHDEIGRLNEMFEATLPVRDKLAIRELKIAPSSQGYTERAVGIVKNESQKIVAHISLTVVFRASDGSLVDVVSGYAQIPGMLKPGEEAGFEAQRFFGDPQTRADVLSKRHASSVTARIENLVVVPEKANQAPVPTPASVTPAADAPVAPDAGAAHL